MYAVGGVRVTAANRNAAFALGDAVAIGAPLAPHHSMIIEGVVNGQAQARGFNNAGGFGGQPTFIWDPNLHDLADPGRWDANDNFMFVNGPAQIRVFSYAIMEPVIRDLVAANAQYFSD